MSGEDLVLKNAGRFPKTPTVGSTGTQGLYSTEEKVNFGISSGAKKRQGRRIPKDLGNLALLGQGVDPQSGRKTALQRLSRV